MSVLLETSLGDLVIDLETSAAPRACSNFLKLAKIHYFTDSCFFEMQRGFVLCCGDPTEGGEAAPASHRARKATKVIQDAGMDVEMDDGYKMDVERIEATTGGDSIFGLMYGPQARFFANEQTAQLGHTRRGTVSLLPLGGESDMNTSRFLITLSDDLRYLDAKHTVFGHVAEGLDAFLERLDRVITDEKNRPRQNIRIRHAIVLDDPFPDPPALSSIMPPASPIPIVHPFDWEVLAEEESLDAQRRTQLSADELEKESQMSEARSRAVVLEMLGDLPDADVAPPENVLFVCKLNPVTRSEDLELLFGRFGEIVSCEVIKDWKTGASLQYAFIEFAEKESCEQAYLKMNNVLVDDRRIKVDFSQSVSKQWNAMRREKIKRKRMQAAAAAGVNVNVNAARVTHPVAHTPAVPAIPSAQPPRLPAWGNAPSAPIPTAKTGASRWGTRPAAPITTQPLAATSASTAHMITPVPPVIAPERDHHRHRGRDSSSSSSRRHRRHHSQTRSPSRSRSRSHDRSRSRRRSRRSPSRSRSRSRSPSHRSAHHRDHSHSQRDHHRRRSRSRSRSPRRSRSRDRHRSSRSSRR